MDFTYAKPVMINRLTQSVQLRNCESLLECNLYTIKDQYLFVQFLLISKVKSVILHMLGKTILVCKIC